VNLTKKYLARHAVNARVEFSGAPRGKSPATGDAIVRSPRQGRRCARTGCALLTPSRIANRLIANRTAAADSWKREKIANVLLMLSGAIAAYTKVGIMLNVRKEQLAAVLVFYRAQESTVSTLSDPDGLP